MAGNYNLVVSDGNGCVVTVNNINVADGCMNCQATTGTLSIDATPITFDGINAVQISATQTSNPNVPAGFAVLYVLTTGTGLEIVNVSINPSFTVSTLGSFTTVSYTHLTLPTILLV